MTSPPAAPAQLLGDAVRRGLGDRAGGGDDALRAAVALLEPHDGRLRPLGLEVAQVLGRRAAQAVDRLVVVAGRADLAVLARQQPQQQALGEVRVLQLVDEHVAVALGDPRAYARLRAQEAEGVEQQVAEVERPRLLEPAVVGGVDGGELALAVGLGAERLRPRPVVLVRDELVLEAVDAGDDRAEQRARVAADVVGGEPQLVDPLEQHREPVGGRDGGGERVEPRLQRLVVQDARADAVDRGDGQLLEAAVEPGLEALAQAVGGGLGARQDEDRLGREAALAHEPAEALAEDAGLAGAGAAEDQQRAAPVRDGLELAVGQRHHRRIGPVGGSERAWDTDWLQLCRRATDALRGILAGAPSTAERVREVGTRGEGGDRTLVIDAAAEDAVFAELERLHDEGLRFTAVSEERGTVDFGDPDTLVIVDPLDGSVNAKRGLPHHSISIAVADGPTMEHVFFGYVYDFGPEEEWIARRGKGAWLDRALLSRAAGERRDADGRLELLGIESADPRWVAEAAEALAGQAYRLRALGTMASSVCQVAAARLDGMVSLKRCRAVDVAAAQLIVREAGGLVAFPWCDDPLGAPLDIPPHSPIVAARTEATLAELARIPADNL